MAVIGSATLNVVPKVEGGLANAINAEISKANVSGLGKAAGSGFMSGFEGGAAIGVWSAVAQRAIAAVTGSLDGAISRSDTLANYPKVMTGLMGGTQEAAEAADRSMKVLSTSLDNVPTKLDDMANVVQGMFAASMKYGTSLDTVTDAGLALNSMLLAGGQSTQVVNSAMEQFRQMLSKGKPELQDWRSLISAAPGQMNQLAEAMLGAGASADDLYAALGGGKEADYGGPFEWGSLGMDEFIERFAGMRDQFEGAAEDAQGGISTAYANMGNAVTKGTARVIEALGREEIVGVITDVKDAINGLFGSADAETGLGTGLVGFAKEAAPALQGLWDSIKGVAGSLAPEIGNIASAVGTGLVGGIKLASGALDAFSDGWSALRDLFGHGSTGAQLFGDTVQALSGTADAVGRSYDVLGGTLESALDRARDSAGMAREAHQEYLDVVASGARDVAGSADAWRAQASQLEYAGSVIEAYAGNSETTAAQQRELKDAIDVVNEVCGTQYEVLEDGFTVFDNSTEKVVDNTTAIWDNIRAREELSRAEGMGAAKRAAQDSLDAAVNDMEAQRQAAADAQDALDVLVEKYGSLEEVRQKAYEVDSLGRTTAEAREAMDVYSAWVRATEAVREADGATRQHRQSVSELGAEQEALAAKAAGAELSVGQMALTSSTAMQAFNDGGSKAELSIVSFADAIEQCAEKGDALNSVLGDPDKMARAVAAYDGTAESLGQVFSDMEVGWDGQKAAALDAQGTIEEMGELLMGLGTDAYGAMQEMGGSTSEMAAALVAAGVSMQDLESIGTESFGRLLTGCGGSMETLTWMIENYNNVPIVTKSGDVLIDEQQLVDAQGRIAEWNGTELVYKGTDTKVEDGQLQDAQGRVYEWNGTELKALSTSVSVDTSDIDVAQSRLDHLSSHYSGVIARGTVYVDTVNRVSGSGGHYTFAKGGHVVPRHASGYFATQPTYTNFGLVGEAGTEAIVNHDDGSSTVYPITNRQFSDPLADNIAERIVQKSGGMGASVTVILNYSAGEDANQLARDLARAIQRANLSQGR